MSAEEIRERLGYDLIHDARLRQRILDAITQGRDSANTNTHSIVFDHGRQWASVTYDLSNDAPVEYSLSDFADFVRASNTCTAKSCRRCASEGDR